jgi:tetratricopeptide (TPR) repeat protein
MPQARRNDPCPCGSGKKFKKCCFRTPDLAQPYGEQRARAIKKISEGEWSAAIELLQSIVHHVPDAFNVWRAIGACYDGLEDYRAAQTAYEKALESCPDDLLCYAHYNLAIARACAGDFEAAIVALEDGMALTNDSLFQQGLRDLISALNDVLNGLEDPRFILAHVQLQRAFSDMDAERYQAAASRLEKIVTLDDTNPAVFYNLGVAYTFLKREDEALSCYEKAVLNNPNYVQALFNMGQIWLLKKRDVSRALHFFDRAVTLQPDYLSAHHQRGIAWELLGDYQRALECWERTLELDPENKMAAGNIERVRGLISPGAGQARD